MSLVPLREQLKNDKIFRQWMTKKPPLKLPGKKPWRVYVQQEAEGGWALALFRKYSDAYRFMSDRINDVPDITVNCGCQPFKPPIIKGSDGKRHYRLPQLQVPPDAPHQWCPYCRRLSIFRPFSKHHALRIIGVDNKWYNFPIRYIDRCTICGAALSMIPRYS